ncbi:hypothetical protein [Tritonibacter mobilis]|uniref:hypothetical protein n=2 Tax=Tritonibacter mobilis TaxID=379347 RepID=UPI000806A54A|nr:hypothetical protein [Tritonibacter mobilis]
MQILAMDVATNTGLCVGSPGAIPRAWTVNLGEAPRGGRLSKEDKERLDAQRFSNVLQLTHGLIAKNEPDLIVIEAPIGGREANAYLIGLVACIRGCAANRGVKCITSHESTVRKHFLGKAYRAADFPTLKKAEAKKAIKRLVAQRCRSLKWDPETLDEADAMALWDWACATQVKGFQAAPVGGLFT